MEKYYEGILIRSASFRLIDVKNYKNGKRYEIISEEEYISPSTDFTNKQYLYSLDYSDFSNFMSNNYGATDKLKLNKSITIYTIGGDINHEGQVMIVEAGNRELLFLNDLIKEENDNLVYLSDYNIKYLRELKEDINIEELLSFIKYSDNKKLILK